MIRNATSYEVLVDEKVEKDLAKVPNHIVEKFLNSLDEFEINPVRSRPGFDAKRLKGFPGNMYRLRIGNYRVLYSVDNNDRVIQITTIMHRSVAYK